MSARVVGEKTEICLTFTGIPKNLVAEVRDIVQDRKQSGESATAYSVYWEAVKYLMEAARKRKSFSVPAQSTGENAQRVVVWLEEEKANELNAFQASWGRGNRSCLLIAALEMYTARRAERLKRRT